jgi:hypothetical protein
MRRGKNVQGEGRYLTSAHHDPPRFPRAPIPKGERNGDDGDADASYRLCHNDLAVASSARTPMLAISRNPDRVSNILRSSVVVVRLSVIPR